MNYYQHANAPTCSKLVRGTVFLSLVWSFVALTALAAQPVEWALKAGISGSYVVWEASNTRWFGVPSEERFDPAGGVSLKKSLNNRWLFVGTEVGLTAMGAGRESSFFTGTAPGPDRSLLLFLTMPVFVGARATSGMVRPFVALGAGPHFLLRRQRPPNYNPDIAQAIDNYRFLTLGSFADIGFRTSGKRPMEFGLQWQRTIRHGSSSLWGNLYTVNAQVYTRFVFK
jgi:hypothetical protein